MRARHLLRSLLVTAAVLITLAPSATRAAPAAAGTWTMTGSMHQARGFQTAVLLPSGLVLVAGGCHTCSSNDPEVGLTSAELYHPGTGNWTATGSMHEPRLQYTATLLRDGRVLVIGGCRTSICTIVLAGAEIYHPHTGSWATTGSMHEPRTSFTATLLPDGRVLVAGGITGNCVNGTCQGITAGAEIYNPQTGAWTLTGSMHQARARQTAVLLPDGRVLVVGGAAGGASHAGTGLLAGAEIYDPRTGNWTMTGSMHTAASGRAVLLLRNGLILVAGGRNDSGWITNAELYHPSTGTWTVTGSLHDPRDYQTGQQATLLGNGKVLVVGGCLTLDCSTLLAGAELYNPNTGTWTVTGSMHEARLASTATLLSDGRVLVAGGAGTDNMQAGAELYHP